MLVAGGTDVYPGMKRRIFTPKQLIALGNIAELKKFEQNGGLSLGAGLTLSHLINHSKIRSEYPALATAARAVSTPQLRNMGTIGGNLCLDTRCNYYNQTEEWRKAIDYCMKKDGHVCWVAPGSPRCWAVNSSDTAPVMIALGARVRLVGTSGERVIPVEALYKNDGINYLGKAYDEILVEINLPKPDQIKMAYQKLRRRGSVDFPILGVAAALRFSEDRICTEAKIVLNAVTSSPIRATASENLLVNNELTDELIREAASMAGRPAKPLDNTDMSLSYRKKMVPVFVYRVLHEVSQQVM